MSVRRDYEELVVITKTYDLILWSCHHTGKFPRNQRCPAPAGRPGQGGNDRARGLRPVEAGAVVGGGGRIRAITSIRTEGHVMPQRGVAVEAWWLSGWQGGDGP